jgi:uncharacterized repeat protein (TIGR03803 family)
MHRSPVLLILFLASACSAASSVQSLVGAPDAGLRNQASGSPRADSGASFATIHDFDLTTDDPLGPLSVANSTLYSISKGDTIPQLYSFAADGSGFITTPLCIWPNAIPNGGLVTWNGALYGTATRNLQIRASKDLIYSVGPSGSCTKIFSFSTAGSNRQPLGPLEPWLGNLYGVTHGPPGEIFGVTQSGQEIILHTFGTSKADGIWPNGGLVALKGFLWGTTFTGGANANLGVVFKVDSAGHYKVVHTFAGGNVDGGNPQGGLTVANGTLYGTTSSGGEYGAGTVYSLSATGTYQNLHSFLDTSEAKNPVGNLLYAYGKLYGVSSQGGQAGAGTLFSVRLDGTFALMHTFSGPDGHTPTPGLIAYNNSVYGITQYGGAANFGTVFESSP